MQEITTGCIVRFKEVIDAGDEKARMVVIDDNGPDCERCMVQHLGTGLPLAPVNTYLKTELVVVMQGIEAEQAHLCVNSE